MSRSGTLGHLVIVPREKSALVSPSRRLSMGQPGSFAWVAHGERCTYKQPLRLSFLPRGILCYGASEWWRVEAGGWGGGLAHVCCLRPGSGYKSASTLSPEEILRAKLFPISNHADKEEGWGTEMWGTPAGVTTSNTMWLWYPGHSATLRWCLYPPEP